MLMTFALICRDRSRSVVNLNAQLIGAVVTDKFCGELLPDNDQQFSRRPSQQTSRGEDKHVMQQISNDNEKMATEHGNSEEKL